MEKISRHRYTNAVNQQKNKREIDTGFIESKKNESAWILLMINVSVSLLIVLFVVVCCDLQMFFV